MFGSAASAAPATLGDKLVRPIVRLDDGHPDVTVIPAHMPVPASSTGIGPGSQLLIDRPDGSFVCTANFIWTNTTKKSKPAKAGKAPKSKKKKKAPRKTMTTTYLGAAGHCFLPEGTTSTHGPDADFDPAFATVSVCVDACEFGGQLGPVFGDFVQLGRVAYARQTKDDVDASNDFGIVEIPDTISRDLIRPSVPVWEGPSGVEDVTAGKGVCIYGNGTGTGEVFVTKARAGAGEGLGDNGRYWKAFMPSTPGDSGSALVTCGQDQDGLHGRGAAGILTHIGLTQETARVLGTTTSRAVEMTKEDTGMSLHLMLEDGSVVAPPEPPPLPPLPPPITPNEDVNAVDVGGAHSWEAGPFTRVAPPPDLVLGEACSGTEPASEHCDYEFVDLSVPSGGAELTVTVSSDDPTADFDLFVYGPDGKLVDQSASFLTPPEEVSKVVTEPGVYTIGVDPYLAAGASYSGLVELEPPPPPPEPEFDGEISPGESYAWDGDPPLDANPVFTCAELVSAFCDNELIKINVPSGGATLVVDITADFEGDDFDVCIYTPSGTQSCSGVAGDEHVELPVTLTGVYRVGVSAFFAPLGTYGGVSSLR